MPSTSNAYGFIVEGSPRGVRMPIPWAVVFAAYAELDARIDPEMEAYLSNYVYPQEFVEHVRCHGSVRGYRGPCGGDFAWVDIDRSDLDEALMDAKRLVLHVTNALDADTSSTLLFFSGSKGFHVGIPLHWLPPMEVHFPTRCRKFVEGIAADAGVAIDTSIYDVVRLLRAPNSRHPKTGLFKRWLPVEGIEWIGLQQVLELAKSPEPFEVPDIGSAVCPKLNERWDATRTQLSAAVATPKFSSNNTAAGRLNRDTIDFLRQGARKGERANRLFKASANLAELNREYGADRMAYAVLEQAARESGLPPSEIRHNFESGWKRGSKAEGRI